MVISSRPDGQFGGQTRWKLTCLQIPFIEYNRTNWLFLQFVGWFVPGPSFSIQRWRGVPERLCHLCKIALVFSVASCLSLGFFTSRTRNWLLRYIRGVFWCFCVLHSFFLNRFFLSPFSLKFSTLMLISFFFFCKFQSPIFLCENQQVSLCCIN
jgi:hypothetical protein